MWMNKNSVRTADITILIIAVRFIKKIPEGKRKSVKKVTRNSTWNMYQRDMLFIVIRLIFGI